MSTSSESSESSQESNGEKKDRAGSKVAHLLGNGPSREKFNPAVEAGDFYGCNLSDFSLPLKCTFIMDKVVIAHITENKLTLPWPAVLANRITKFVKKYDGVEVHDIIYNDLMSGISTGHRAAEWMIQNGYEVIHMWGFDSLWHHSIASDSHQKMPQGPYTERNVPRWKVAWDKIFKKHTEIKFIERK